MSRLYGSPTENNDPGTLAIEFRCCSLIDVYYVPSKERLEESGFTQGGPYEHRAKLLQIDFLYPCITIFPIKTRAHRDTFLKPKYDQIEKITIEYWDDTACHPSWFRPDYKDYELPLITEEQVVTYLETMPLGFIKNYDYGLGFEQRYRLIVDTVKDLTDCTDICISPIVETGIEEKEKIFFISLEDFHIIRKSIDRTKNHFRKVTNLENYAYSRNILAERIGQPPIHVETRRSPLQESITEAAARGERSLSQKEQDEVLGVLARNVESFAKNKPRKLATLKRDMELVELETLIERFEEMLRANQSERNWQLFLNENSFLLNLAFGCPVVKVRGQVSVGGHKHSGDGGKVTDFLVKNKLTNNSALVEIKRPSTQLLNERSYREGVFAPSRDLVGAVNQVLDQKHHFELEFTNTKVKSRLFDIESFSVRCCLIVGTMPDDVDRLKSFELYRGNSKNVEIITFDEVLENLKNLRNFINLPKSEATTKAPVTEVPF